MELLYYTALKEDEGRELKSILRCKMKLSASLVRKLKNAGGIFVNSRPVFTDYRVSEGDTVSCDIKAAEPESGVVPEQGDIDVIFEDEWLIAVNKPSGLLTHPSRSRYTGTLANFVSGHIGGACHAVNRLDRDTSGIVLFSKSSHAKALAAESLAEEGAEKLYLALAYGFFDEKNGVVDAPIKRLRAMDMRRGVREDGERAVTHFETLNTFECFGDSATLLKIRLETGRTHQIRVHLEHIGRPLLGDALYFTEKSRALSHKLGIGAQALHAFRLSFRHPFSGKRLELVCEVKRKELLPFFEWKKP